MSEMSMTVSFFVKTETSVEVEEISNHPGKLVISFNEVGCQTVWLHITAKELPRLARILVEAVREHSHNSTWDYSRIPADLREVIRQGCGPVVSETSGRLAV